MTAAYVIKNQSQNRSWNIATSVTKPMSHGLSMSGGYGYGDSRSLVEPSSTAGSSWGNANPITFDPNNPALRTIGQRTRQPRVPVRHLHAPVLRVGRDDGVDVLLGKPVDQHLLHGNSYIFSGDANGDTQHGNDLIYIPKDQSEMNFRPLTVGGKTFTPADQAAAFEQYIQNDNYLSSHRGQYAERNGFFSPLVNRMDLSLMQDVFHKVGGARHSGQIRLDITNVGNLLNHNWGVSQRFAALVPTPRSRS